MRHDPFAVLKWVTVQHRQFSMGRSAHVGEDSLGGYDAADPTKKATIDRGCGASSDVWCAIDVEGNSPAIAMVVALRTKRIVRVHEGPMDLALNDAAEAEQPTHNVFILT